jgi:hypothetical protein
MDKLIQEELSLIQQAFVLIDMMLKLTDDEYILTQDYDRVKRVIDFRIARVTWLKSLQDFINIHMN